jgi:3-dehydroquinate synthase
MTPHKHHGEPLNLNWHSSLEVNTRLIIGKGGLSKLTDLLSQIHAGKKVVLLKQPQIFIQEIERMKSALHAEGLSAHILEIPDGEDCKSVHCLLQIWNMLHELKFTRQDTIVAIGGGSLTDVAGFAAATYLRGINLVTIPTTLLAQVDAAIGGKTAINLHDGKNLAGSFYFARATIIDIDTLSTLPASQFISGLAEVIKYSLLEQTIAAESEYLPGPRPLIDVLGELTDNPTWDNVLLPGVIASCIKMKLSVVAKDPIEKNLRRCLNLGHTLGHALETAGDFTLSHGQAVAIGTAFAFRLAVSRKQISEKDEAKAIDLLNKVGLPTSVPAEISTETLLDPLFRDKKREGEAIRLVLPAGSLGQVDYQSLIKRQEIEEALSAFCSVKLS